MATIYVDGKSYEVNGSHNLLQACLELGLEIPYFCWHPAMGSVGACRQCAVKQYKDENDDKGKLVMSCMSPAKDDTHISIDDQEAREFRASVIEWMMLSHPHDCPVCEEGGHCHLQDMTVMTGHDRRRYRFNKRTHRNQNLGPFIAHEMNRCITCYRCVRFYNDYAGGTDLGAFGANDNIYFGRYQEGTLESEFSGNLTEVCPTGVFTDQTHSDHYTRKWDMQFGPSVCHQCAVGCNISAGERYGEIRRIENRYHGEVNRYFLCDRGRFGYGYVNRDDRPVKPEARTQAGTAAETLSVDHALDRAAGILKSAEGVIGIGSPRASLESNHQLRELVGEENFCTGIATREQACLEKMNQLSRNCGLPSPSLTELEQSDAVLVLGEDLIQSAARLGLSVRQAVLGRCKELADERKMPIWNAEAVKTLAQDRRYPLFIAYPQKTGLDNIAEHSWTLAPDDIARFGFAIAHALDSEAPAVPDLDDSIRQQAETIAEALLSAERPLLVSGGSLESLALLDAAGNIARALKRRGKAAGLTLVRREANSTGLTLMGGQPLEWALEQVENDKAQALVVLENDLYQRLPVEQLESALEKLTSLVVLDHQRTPTLERADLSLPAASFAEGDGTLVSLEGRAQRFYQVYEARHMRPETNIHESWRWLHALQSAFKEKPVEEIKLEQVTEACAREHPALAGIVEAGASADLRIEGKPLARQPHRYSGRTAMTADRNVSEPRPPQDSDSPLAFSMEGYSGFDRPRNPIPFAWAPGWNSPEAWHKFTDEVGGHLRAGDPGIKLLQPDDGSSDYSAEIPEAFVPVANQWQLAVLPRLFGGEETSSRAEPIIERAPAPVIALSPVDAEHLQVSAGDPLSISFDDNAPDRQTLTLPLQIDPALPSGLACLPAGLSPKLTTGSRVRLAFAEFALSSGERPSHSADSGGEARP